MNPLHVFDVVRIYFNSGSLLGPELFFHPSDAVLRLPGGRCDRALLKLDGRWKHVKMAAEARRYFGQDQPTVTLEPLCATVHVGDDRVRIGVSLVVHHGQGTHFLINPRAGFEVIEASDNNGTAAEEFVVKVLHEASVGGNGNTGHPLDDEASGHFALVLAYVIHPE